MARSVASEILFPTAISTNKQHVVLATEVMGAIQIVDQVTGEFIRTIRGFDKPGSAIELDDGSVIVSEPSAGRLLRLRGETRDVLVDGLSMPVGLLDAHDGTIYVTESASGKLLRVTIPEGQISEVATGLGAVRAVAITLDGTLITLDGLEGTLFTVDPRTGQKAVIARNLPVGYLKQPYARSGGIAVGSDGTIYLAADLENAIYRIARG